jgi:alpha-galactosidase
MNEVDVHFNVPENAKIKVTEKEELKIYSFDFSCDFEKSSKIYIEISWHFPAKKTHAFWYPFYSRSRNLATDWGGEYKSMANYAAPVGIFIDEKMNNIISFALSDPLNLSKITAGIKEEDSSLYFKIIVYPHIKNEKNYNSSLRIDTREIYYAESLEQIVCWWERAGYNVERDYDRSLLPVYSTWYSFHQSLSLKGLLEEAKIAKELGMGSIFIDDGWHTSDNAKGYGYTGDWDPEVSKIADKKSFTEELHALNLNVLFWFAAPFIGIYSNSWRKLSNNILYYKKGCDFAVLDFRKKENIDYVVNKIMNVVKSYDLDGAKIDFIDRIIPEDENETNISEVAHSAVDFVENIYKAIRSFKEDAIIEFRQNYNGPVMRKYCTAMRAFDCPQDYITNRIRVTDLRLIAGKTPVHSDMLMWNSGDSMQNAAKQIINVLFSVPQVSAKLSELSPEMKKMLKFWLTFWNENKEILMHGQLRPENPEMAYPVISAVLNDSLIIVFHAPLLKVFNFNLYNKIKIINGSNNENILIENKGEKALYKMKARDTIGDIIAEREYFIVKGLNKINVAPSGIIELQKI